MNVAAVFNSWHVAVAAVHRSCVVVLFLFCSCRFLALPCDMDLFSALSTLLQLILKENFHAFFISGCYQKICLNTTQLIPTGKPARHTCINGGMSMFPVTSFVPLS